MSAAGARLWESLASKPGRAVFFPNIPLRLVAPTPEAAAKGLSVVTFITVPSTSKVRVEKSSRRKPPRRELERAAADPRGSRLATRSLLSDARPHAPARPPHRPDRACIVFPHRAPPPPLLADVAQTEVRNLLQSVYGVGVDKVHTANYEGKKKRRGFHYYQKADYKKVYVKLRERWFPPRGLPCRRWTATRPRGTNPRRRR